MRVTLTPYHHRCENWDIDEQNEQLLMWLPGTTRSQHAFDKR